MTRFFLMTIDKNDGWVAQMVRAQDSYPLASGRQLDELPNYLNEIIYMAG